MNAIIPPGSVLGMLGGGQLGRMSMLAGRHLGYRFLLFEPGAGHAASAVADAHIRHSYEDLQALADFGDRIQVATLEFENIPALAVETLAAHAPVYPGSKVLHICQNRAREKAFFLDNNLPCAAFRTVENEDDLAGALAALGVPCVVKTADSGYDGKGQIKIDRADVDCRAIWQKLGAQTCVVEQWIPHIMECSVIVARNGRGQSQCFPTVENIHINHILHQTIVPARVPSDVRDQAEAMALSAAEAIGCIGLLAVELFVLSDGSLLINEMAPRPHNSGHWSLNACITSQFEQHIRAVCGLPLGSTEILRPAVMVNLLGDLWQGNTPPGWSSVLDDPDTHLHLYDKGEPKPGRKMGHFTTVKPTLEEALTTADDIFSRLTRGLPRK